MPCSPTPPSTTSTPRQRPAERPWPRSKTPPPPFPLAPSAPASVRSPAHRQCKHAHHRLPLGQVGTPLHPKGAGKGDAKVALHPHSRKMLLPPGKAGRELVLEAGSVSLAARVTRARGGVKVGAAQVPTRRHGDNHLAPGPPPTPPTRACLVAISGSSRRSLGALATVTLGLAGGPPSPGSLGRSLLSWVTCTR